MTFKVIQRHCRCCHLQQMVYNHCKYISILHRFYFATKIKTSHDLDHAHSGAVCHHRTIQSRWKDPVPPVGKHGASQLYSGARGLQLSTSASTAYFSLDVTPWQSEKVDYYVRDTLTGDTVQLVLVLVLVLSALELEQNRTKCIIPSNVCTE